MATIPTPTTQTAGLVVPAAVINNKRDGLEYLLGSNMTNGGGRRPFAQMRQTIVQSIAVSGTWQAVAFDSEDVDYDGGHSTVTNTDRYTAVTAGWHAVGGGCAFATNATGLRGARYSVNGTAVNGSTVLLPSSTAGTFAVACRPMAVFLNVADILRLEAFQTSGGALNTVATSDSQPSLFAEWRSN